MASVNWVEKNIAEVTKEINEYAEQHEGEISDELLADLEKWQGSKETAIDNMSIEYKSLSTRVDMIKAQEKALADLRKDVMQKAEEVKKSIGIVLRGEKFTTSNSAVSYRKSSSVNIYDENLIPSEFVHTRETVSISKKDIAKAIKEGKKIEGAVLETNYSVVIK